MTRKLWIGIATLALVIVAAVGAASALLSSEWGLRWVLDHVRAWVPGELSIGSAQGRLRGPIALDDLTYRIDGSEYTVGHASIEWDPWRLIGGEIHIARLSISQIRVKVQGKTTSSDIVELPALSSPLRVTIEQSQIEHVSYATTEATPPFEIQSIAFSGSMHGSNLDINKFAARAALFDADLSGRLVAREQFPFSMDSNWVVRIPQKPEIHGHGKFSGDLSSINIEQQVTAPVDVGIQGNVSDILKVLHWRLTTTARNLDLKKIEPTWSIAPVDLDVVASGDLESVDGQVALRSIHDAVGAYELRVSGRYRNSHLTVREIDASLTDSDTHVRANGDVEFDAQAPNGIAKITASGDWQSVRVPLRGAPMVVSPRGVFQVDGTTEKYSFVVDASVHGANVPSGEVKVQGSGDRRHAVMHSIEAATLGGNIRGDASVQWDPAPRWSAHLTGAHVNPGIQWAEWPGSIDFDIAGDGDVKDKHVRTALNLRTASGVLRGYTLSAQARLSQLDDALAIQNAELHSDSAKVRAHGEIGANWNIEWQVDAPKLAALYPKIDGELTASGQVTGPRDSPRVRYSMHVGRAKVENASIEQLESRGDIDFNESNPTRVTLRAKQLVFGAWLVDTISLDLDGALHEHRLSVSARGPDGSADMAIVGQMHEGNWSAQIERADVNQPQFGAWKLEQSVAVDASLQGAHVANLCWRGAQGRICADGAWQRGAAAEAHLAVADLPFADVQFLLPRDVVLTGAFNGSMCARLSTRGDAPPALDAELQLGLTAGQLTLNIVSDESVVFEHRGATLNMRIDAQGARGDARFDIEKLGNASLAVRFPGWHIGTSNQQQAIDAHIVSSIDELGFLSRWIPAAERTRGKVHADVTMTGTWAEPRYDGVVSLRDGAADLPQIGIKLRDIEFEARNQGTDRIALDGKATSGPGGIQVHAEVALDRQAGWPLVIEVKGNEFEAVNLPEAWVLASPDLQIYKVKNRIDLNGSITIPKANYNARDTSSAVSPSQDVVIVGKEQKAVPDEKYQIYTTVRFSFGDAVHFKGFGLKGLVRGEVVAVDEPKKLTTGYGELGVEEATFNAYKIELKVTRGRLLFAGGPINNPGIDARAVREAGGAQPVPKKADAALREPGAIIAGVLVRGTLRNLELTLFSDPPRDQADILSLLLFGVPLGDATSEQGKALFLAASSLRLSGRDETLRKIGRRFGIEEIRLEAGDTPEQASLVLGRYLGPRLYINYSVGLVSESTNVLRIRYRISDKWMLQSEQSDVESAADLLYTFER